MEPYRFDPSKCCRQPRSLTPRRPSRPGYLTDFFRCNGKSGCTSAADQVEASSADPLGLKEMGFHMGRCDMVSTEPSISSSADTEPSNTTSIEINASEESSKRDKNIWLAPGSIAWAKITTSSPWWPAEIMDGKGNPECGSDQPDDLVLVHPFGSEECAWIDPIGCLLHFEDFYEERSSNPSEEFQGALQEALQKKMITTSSPQSDKLDTSSSCRTSTDCVIERRGKRKHKPRVHFDELVSAEKSIRKVRRMKIMRYLGLAAPVGSPFSQPRARNSC